MPRSPLDRVLALLALDPAAVAAAKLARLRNGTDLGAELVAARRIGEAQLAAAIATVLRLERMEAEPAELRFVGEEGPAARLIRVLAPEGERLALVAPRLEDIARLESVLAARPGLYAMLRIATPSELFALHAARTEAARAEAACLSLSRAAPDFSARQTTTGPQGFVAGLAPALLTSLPTWSTALRLLHVVLLALFLGGIALRLGAALSLLRRQGRQERSPLMALAAMGAMPRYSLLVALRNETRDCVAGLVAALDRLDWPRAKLQILMVCEADDPATVAHVRDAIADRRGFFLVETPPAPPRTKPKALNFALPLATGEIVALFDAEDRPNPSQLRAAWEAFETSGADLACVQAPLVVTNGDRGWLPAQFAIEYRVLFGALLPWLARHRLPLPLGGTSNHFRQAALRAVGAWDSHNVTEDADLGMRLARFGYRTAMIAPPTFEEAPERWRDWRNQRTRWMKGWMQSWLVHMRRPHRLARDLGMRDVLVFQLLFAGMIASGLAHAATLPLVLVTVLILAGGTEVGGADALLFGLDVVALALGHGAYAMLALGTSEAGDGTARRLWSLPAYWLLIGLATLRALGQLGRNPQLWEKTPHGSAARRDASPAEKARGGTGTGRGAGLLR
ncbi:glycosyltransferase family 2 protein [Aureimonas endophytica]|nr:glycosyltransferase family 2 protein [Aureimonas endophytica]